MILVALAGFAEVWGEESSVVFARFPVGRMWIVQERISAPPTPQSVCVWGRGGFVEKKNGHSVAHPSLKRMNSQIPGFS